MLDALERWLRTRGRADPRTGADALTALDQAIGDGDHGINMDRGFAAIVASLDAGLPEGRRRPDARRHGRPAHRRPDPDQHGRWRVRAALRDGLHAGRRGDPGRRRRPRPAQVVLDGPRGRRSVGSVALGKATTGEKTMLDALIPALDGRPRPRSTRGRPRRRSSAPWRDAAEAGAAATIPMLATKGRASYLGERSIGHQDPGATSSALLLRTLADVGRGRLTRIAEADDR